MAAVENGPLAATQFHPEKSGDAGATLLRGVGALDPVAGRPLGRVPRMTNPPQALELLPAVDVADGQAVRLVQGEAGTETTYGSPVDAALQLAASRAPSGSTWSTSTPRSAAAATPSCSPRSSATLRRRRVELSGGIRDDESLERALATGCTRVNLGTAALEDPRVAERGHRRARRADRRRPRRQRRDTARRARLDPGGRRPLGDPRRGSTRDGCARYVVTDVTKDGTLKGPNLDLLREVCAATDRAGRRLGRDRRGSRTCTTLAELVPHGRRGRDRRQALYDGPFTLAEAITAIEPRYDPYEWGPRGEPMSVAVRVIPCLDVDAGRVVKGVNFDDLRDAGDPVELAAAYDAEGADELTFLDITASSSDRATTYDVVRRTAEQVFIPLTVGGGVRSREDVDRLLRAGADKVGVNTAAIARPELLSEAAERFGAQCSCCPSTRGGAPRACTTASGFEVTTHGGRAGTGHRRGRVGGAGARLGRGRDPAQLDGRRRHRDGFDLALIERCAARCRVPVIASGGAGAVEHFVPGGAGRGRRGAGRQRLPLRHAGDRRGQGRARARPGTPSADLPASRVRRRGSARTRRRRPRPRRRSTSTRTSLRP